MNAALYGHGHVEKEKNPEHQLSIPLEVGMAPNSRMQPAPFKVGQEVIYTPSQRGHDLDANFDGRLEPGRRYRIVDIQKDSYVVVQGDDHPGGGIYWTEFSPVPAHIIDE